MKVKIGPYLTYYGPYQIVNLLRFFGVPQQTRENLAERLIGTWVGRLCEKVHEWRNSKRVYVRIDETDTWNFAETLAHIILPMLEQHKKNTPGAPDVDDEDVPEYLRRSAAPPVDETTGETDELWHFRWQWVLDEMIWAFSQINDPDNEDHFWSSEWHAAFENPDMEAALAAMREKPESEIFDRAGYEAHHARINRGTTLFGKYYRSLWE